MEFVVIRNDSDELAHHGTKGMQWGRRLYQNKDGTLTPLGKKRYNKETERLKKEEEKIKAAEKVASNKKKTQAKFDKLDAKKAELEERKKALKGGGKKEADNTPEETPAERKARIAESPNPKDVYDNRDLFTDAELKNLNNRFTDVNNIYNKIPVEPEKKTGLDRMETAKQYIDKSTALYKSIDGATSAVANSFIGKTVADALGIELPKQKAPDWDNMYKNMDKLDEKQMQSLANYTKNKYSAINTVENYESKQKKAAKEAKKEADEAAKETAKKQENERKAAEAEAKKKAAEESAEKIKKQVDDYNKKWQEGDSNDRVSATDYNYKKEDLSNAREDTRAVKDYPAVIGSTSVSAVTSTKAYSTGENYANRNASKTKVTRVSDADADIIEPEWYTRMKRNGQI